MKYLPPLRDNKPYWIPIVCKNKDYLIGFLNGKLLVEYTLIDVLKQFNINFDFENLDLFLDSSRFNDVMEDGRREHELSDKEKKNLFIKIFKNKINDISKNHIDDNTHYKDVLRIECKCGLGFYGWKEFKDIPSEQFRCSECDRVLIDYTENDDFNYEFDGGQNENQ